MWPYYRCSRDVDEEEYGHVGARIANPQLNDRWSYISYGVQYLFEHR